MIAIRGKNVGPDCGFLPRTAIMVVGKGGAGPLDAPTDVRCGAPPDTRSVTLRGGGSTRVERQSHGQAAEDQR
jgi:hypothetical protein